MSSRGSCAPADGWALWSSACPEGSARPLWNLYVGAVLPLAGRLISPEWRRVGGFLGPSIRAFAAAWPPERLAAAWDDGGIESVRPPEVPLERLLWGLAAFAHAWFALGWGSFPVLTAYVGAAETIRPEALLAGVFAACLSLAQRRLSTQVRNVRRRAAAVTGAISFRDGREEPSRPRRSRALPRPRCGR